MKSTRLLSDGRITVPKALRDAYGWRPRQELVIVDTGGGLLLKTARPFPETTLEQVTGSLEFDGPPKTLEEMEQAIKAGIASQGWRRAGRE